VFLGWNEGGSRHSNIIMHLAYTLKYWAPKDMGITFQLFVNHGDKMIGKHGNLPKLVSALLLQKTSYDIVAI